MEAKYRTDIDQTVEYYEKNAAAFIESTIDADVSELYQPFEELLFPGCRILDLGCGSGRDSKYFTDKGYEVVAIDPSPAMCTQTRSLAHIPVYEMKAEEMSFSNEFDAVWACASLLHIPYVLQAVAFENIAKALKPGGIFYGSWKYGNREHVDQARVFSDYDKDMLQDIIQKTGLFDEIKLWITDDVRRERKSQRWINCLVQRKNEGLAPL